MHSTEERKRGFGGPLSITQIFRGGDILSLMNFNDQRQDCHSERSEESTLAQNRHTGTCGFFAALRMTVLVVHVLAPLYSSLKPFFNSFTKPMKPSFQVISAARFVCKRSAAWRCSPASCSS